MPKVNQIAVKNPQTGEYEIADISSSALNITFDGGNLDLDAEDVQGAIEEIKGLVDENTSDIGTLTTTVNTKSTVSVDPALDSGTEVGTVTVDGVDTVLYAPTPIVPVDVEGNPDDPAEETLTKILIDDVVYGLPNDQGSVVTVTPIQQSGTNIVDIDVDNVTYHVYAPTPPTVIPNDSAPSQTTTPLTNITVNGDTYTTNQVSANPQGTGTDLETISIDGVVYNIPQGSSTVADLEDLDNVEITSPTNGQVLKYDSSSDTWINGTGGSSVGDLDDLGDVTLTTPTDGQVLKYDGTNQIWVNANESTGSTVVWNQIQSTGTKIATVSVDGTSTDVYAPTSGGATSLAGLSDVTVSSVSNGQVLKYDSTNQVWVNANESSSTKIYRVEVKTNSIGGNDASMDLKYYENGSLIDSDINIVYDTVDVTPLNFNNFVQLSYVGSGTNSWILTALTDCEYNNVSYSNGDEIRRWGYETRVEFDVTKTEQSSGSGHTILDNSSTALTQRDDLQFIGAYVNDDSTNEITKVNVVREMTKAQFDLLSNDEKVGLIRTTDENDGVYSPLNYSTNEQKTGQKWIDGSDVYQKTYTGTIDADGETEIADFTNKKIIGVDGWFSDSNDTLGMSLGYFPQSQTWSSALHINPNNKLMLMNNSALYNGNYYITVKYIKTT